jgi:hypothetical protein
MIDRLVDQLTEAMHCVSAAQPDQEIDGAAPDVYLLNDLIAAATHETASTIGFLLADIRALQARLRLREAFAEFTDDQFDTIVKQGWSLDLVGRICGTAAASGCDKKTVSHRIRELVAAYSALPRPVVKALNGIDARRGAKG